MTPGYRRSIAYRVSVGLSSCMLASSRRARVCRLEAPLIESGIRCLEPVGGASKSKDKVPPAQAELPDGVESSSRPASRRGGALHPAFARGCHHRADDVMGAQAWVVAGRRASLSGADRLPRPAIRVTCDQRSSTPMIRLWMAGWRPPGTNRIARSSYP